MGASLGFSQEASSMAREKAQETSPAALQGTKKKWWKPLRARTARGHLIEGFLCKHRKAGTLSGALQVRSVDEQPCNQVLYGMPEIPYPEQRAVTVNSANATVTFTRKMDGTALLFSPLKLPSGDFEVFARTRGMPVLRNTRYRAWRDIVAGLVDEAMEAALEKACVQQSATLAFELWGHKNRHTVSYEEGLELSLHSMIKGREVSSWPRVSQMARSFKIPVVTELERVSKVDANRIIELGQAWIDRYERQNDPERGIYREEGVVALVETGQTARLWKFKPPSMAEFHRLARRKIRSITVRHEAFKLLESDLSPSLENLLTVLAQVFSAEAVDQELTFIEDQYWSWCKDAGIQGTRKDPQGYEES
jgi:hypothetical protein